MTCSPFVRAALYLVSGTVCAIAVISIRVFAVLVTQHAPTSRPRQRPRDAPASLAIFLGSGGHSAEMMRLVAHLDPARYASRTWIVSSGDSLSDSKALAYEKHVGTGHFRILKIPRARRVHQSYLTSPFTTLYSLAFCLYHISFAPLLSARDPKFADLILLNGPGSCVPIAASAFLPRLFFLESYSPRLVYIESLARTRRLSLSAKIVRPLVDRFFVQWESLRTELVKKDRDQEQDGSRWRLKARVECQGWLV